MFNFNRKIGNRIAAGYYIILALAVFAGGICFWVFQNNKMKNDSMISVHNPTVNGLKEYRALMRESSKLIYGWVYYPNMDDKKRLALLQEKDFPQLKENFSSLEKQTDDETLKKNLIALTLGFDSLVQNEKIIMNTLSNEDSYVNDSLVEIAIDIHDARIAVAAKNLETKVDKVLKSEEKIQQQVEDELSNSYTLLTFVIIGLVVLILAVSVVASGIAGKTITKPILELKDVVQTLGRGEIPSLHLQEREDEIGDMTTAIGSLTDSVKRKSEFARETGKGNYELELQLLSENDLLGASLIEMRDNLKEAAAEEAERNWMSTGIAQLGEVMRANQDNLVVFYGNTISFVVRYLQLEQGAVFLLNKEKKNDNYLQLISTYAYDKKRTGDLKIRTGEGFVGQIIIDHEPIFIDNLPENYTTLSSGLGNASPKHLSVFPLLFEGELMGVLELASLDSLKPNQKELLTQFTKTIAATIELVNRKKATETLLTEAQELNERMKAQEEELKVNNEELMEKTKMLQSSEEELRVQQEELQQTNVQLEEKALQLAQQNDAIRVKNDELETAREALKLKAEELERTSKYKSEFLANMSHELRTPLNSIMILSNLLAENKKSNLDDKQLEYAKVIQRSGGDLLQLINDILDLSKIESRKIDLEIEPHELSEIEYDISSLFTELAKSKGINFSVVLDADVSKVIATDKMRVEQIIKNLLSNAFKFTPKDGEVKLHIYSPDDKHTFRNPNLLESGNIIGFAVSDTGIGIPKDKQQLIFEAFQQADGSTSRKYGGTGLGLSISRELSLILGGEIQVESEAGVGSRFTLFLPAGKSDKKPEHFERPKETIAAAPVAPTPAPSPTAIPAASPRNPSILIIEDDDKFRMALIDFAQSKKFEVFAAADGEEGLKMAREKNPGAIILDIGLPKMDGWKVMEHLKSDPLLKNIPVHIMTGNENRKKGMEMGAIEFLVKPIAATQLNSVFDKISRETTHAVKSVLIVEDNAMQSQSIRALLENTAQECTTAATGKEALSLLASGNFDLVILDLSLPDTSGFDLLKLIKENAGYATLPVIIYTGRTLSEQENQDLMKYSSSVILKTAQSYDRLLDESKLFLNKISTDFKAPVPTSATGPVNMAGVMKGKKVLVVDDDMRNIFALTSILEAQEMELVIATDGRESLNRLQENEGIDLVLMDIMMPEMDGYAAMREIRKILKFKNLPIIALTAKAMKGDREKCIEAGASDYISKPIDTNKLLSLMQVWLFK